MNAFIRYAPGVSVMHAGVHYVITHLSGLESVLAKNQENGQIVELPIKDLSPFSEPATKAKTTVKKELSIIDAADWIEAEKWEGKLRALSNSKQITKTMVTEVAAFFGVHSATVYRRLKIFRTIGKVSALVKTKRNGGKGKSRLPAEVEAIIQSTINSYYFNKQKQKRSKRDTFYEIKNRLESAKIKVPGERTVYNRINSILNDIPSGDQNTPPDSDELLNPVQITGADYPLALVQIDHTEVDIDIVDEIYRQSIGRPWITVLIDVFSRMILGFYISLDPPGDIAVGLCLSHGILPKEKWLAKFNISVSYPCWGVMDIIHADNAGEFRGEMIRRACKEYGMDIEWRPVKQPHYGAHIERLLGIVLKEIHKLPGTTFSNIEEKGDYIPEKYSQMTLSELEKWLALFVTGVYHQKFHSSLNTTPIKKYEKGILGTKDLPGRGLPKGVADEDRLCLDLMPIELRTIRDNGIVIDHIRYYSGVLSRYKNAKDLENPKRKRQFIFKRDPRNINAVYFYDPELNEYFRVPYRNTSYPPMSIWEYQKVRRHLKKLGEQDVDEKIIFETYDKMRKVEEQAAFNTKAARRASQRRLEHKKIVHPKTPREPKKSQSPIGSKIKPKKRLEIVPYDEIEIFDE